MKQIIIILSFCFLAIPVSKGQWIGSSSDLISISLTAPSGSVEGIGIALQELASDNYDGSRDAIVMTPQTYNFTTVAWNVNSDREQLLLFDYRPYKGRFYVDFPLSFQTKESGEYKIAVSAITRENKMVFIRLVDNENLEEFIILDKEGNIPYSVNLSGNLDCKGRYTLRVYAASLFKENPVDADWNNLSNWMEVKEVPGSGSSKYDNCVIIPNNVSVELKTGNLAIGTLLNSGDLTIQQGAVLSITDEAKNASVTNYY